MTTAANESSGDVRPLVLLSNDDGVNARNLHALREALTTVVNVIVVAPEREQSANSHSLTLSGPLRHRVVAPDIHAIDGTPADCVYVGLFGKILPRKPDLVASGINHGHNLGTDVYYSGTVAAAREAALRGIPAIAFSLAPGGDPIRAAAIAMDMVLGVAALGAKGAGLLLNVNFPRVEPKGVRLARLGRRDYNDEVAIRVDPRGREYLWIGGDANPASDEAEGTDTRAISEGYVSVTPLELDATCSARFDDARRATRAD